MLFAAQSVISLTVIARIGREPLNTDMWSRMAKCRFKITNVRLRTLVGQVTKNEMIRAVDQYAELWIEWFAKRLARDCGD